MKRFAGIAIALLWCADVLQAQQNPYVLDYIEHYKQLAMQEMMRSGVPAAITLAQGIHESESGKSMLASRSNNHFGIKCRPTWEGEKVYHDDDARQECFRSYPSVEDSYRDHSDFLRNGQRYAFLFQLKPVNYKAWAHGLKKAGYATNRKYAHILIDLIEEYQLQQFTLLAMGKSLPEEALARNTRADNRESSGAGPSLTEEEVTEEEDDAVIAARYPAGVFRLNDTKVMFAPAGTALLAVAEVNGLSLAHLLDFNDLYGGDLLIKGQLLYLQRKRKRGAVPAHVVQPGENCYTIAQTEALRLESLLEYNHLSKGMEPAVGETLFLQEPAASTPRLRSAVNTAARKTYTSAPSAEAGNPIRYRVAEKETLYSIARKYQITVEDLIRWNQLNGSAVKTGQELLIFK
ncbi:MAG: glucosaminidase domain-containing protein [Chitinophagaceae bacterium]